MLREKWRNLKENDPVGAVTLRLLGFAAVCAVGAALVPNSSKVAPSRGLGSTEVYCSNDGTLGKADDLVIIENIGTAQFTRTDNPNSPFCYNPETAMGLPATLEEEQAFKNKIQQLMQPAPQPTPTVPGQPLQPA